MNVFVWRSSCTKAKASQKEIFHCNFFCHRYAIWKIPFFLLNFYFCDSTAIRSPINLRPYFSTNPLSLWNGTCKYFIHVSCVRESADTGRQLIYTKQSFCYKSKDIFHGSKKVFFKISGLSRGDTRWWGPHKFISNADLGKHLSEQQCLSFYLSNVTILNCLVCLSFWVTMRTQIPTLHWQPARTHAKCENIPCRYHYNPPVTAKKWRPGS